MARNLHFFVGIMTRQPRLLLCALFGSILLGTFACETPLGPIRATTFPPDLSYLPPESIRTAMWVLAAEIEHLEQLLGNPYGDEPVPERTEVVKTLERMRVAAKTLDQPGRNSQHPVLNENLDRFLGRLERAKRSADRDPPDYFPASSIAGSCYLCHGQNRASGNGRQAPAPGTS
jgi:hypothetical protein